MIFGGRSSSFDSFDVFENNLTFYNIQWGYDYRSSISRKVVKHCIEMTILDKNSKCSEIGFANTFNTRTFVSYFEYDSPNGIFQLDSESRNSFECNISLEEKETVEVCFDSKNNIFNVIKGEEICTQEINLTKGSTYFAFLTHGQFCDYNTVSINVGMSPYKNKIPDGYSTWIDGLIKYKCKEHYRRQFSVHQGLLFVLLNLYN